MYKVKPMQFEVSFQNLQAVNKTLQLNQCDLFSIRIEPTWFSFDLTRQNWKRSDFTKSSCSLERVQQCLIFEAQMVLVPTSLSSEGKSICFNELVLSLQVDALSFCAVFAAFPAFIVWLWHQTLVQPHDQLDGVALIKICKHLICMRPIWILFVEVVSVQLAASRRYKQNCVWAKTFIDWAGELPRNLFAQEQRRFVLLVALNAINASEFTWSFSWMKFRPQCPNLCCVHSALLAWEWKLAQLRDVVRAYCQ